ncbi:MAG: protein kinase domain-containing protein [Planctomycetota bacterium]|jgi:serine/threonine protein kinase
MAKKLTDIKLILAEASEKRTIEERSAYLARACGDDVCLRQEVESLLQMEDKVGDFLESPILDPGATLEESPLAESPGTVIGRYKLLEKIGEGGMAVVYMAEQERPIRRKVALKIIKLGMDTKQVIARFEAERQALAMMDHSNIAKVFDAGATETGRPYFVMELVTGVSITEYCDKNNLSTKDRLALFTLVCNAVQHAHQKGIIHRDIKPTNVMVTQHEGAPVPKVIDFGIAKATNQKLTEKTLFTRYAHIIGTPAYMSPEQAESSDVDIDTRSDIYSLGVLLYELLTSTTPFGEEELRKAGYLEMQRIIREEEPTKPSTKLSTLGKTLTDIAKHHGSTPDLLRKAVRGDLDWIVMKTLEKARDRRYDTVSALTMDVERHLKDEPILARAPGTVYCLHKFFRRHQIRIIASLVMSVLAVTLIVVLLERSHERRLRDAQRFLEEKNTLWRAINTISYGGNDTALPDLESILHSKHFGPEARRLRDHILAEIREEVRSLAEKIKTNPEDALHYLHRAHRYNCLGETANMIDDMEMYVKILSPLDETNPHDLWFRDFLKGLWQSTPTNLGRTVNSWSKESTPSISADGLSLYFSLKRFGERADLWVTTRATVWDPWDPPVNLGPTINSSDTEDTPSISYDGLTLYFSSWQTDEHMDLWKTTRQTTDDKWAAPVNLGPTINSSALDWSPTISKDGLLLVFSSNRPGGIGKTDLWMTRRSTTDDPWSEPENLGQPVNSPDIEATPSISDDGLLLFFQSDRPGEYGGGADIWVARRKTTDDPWSQPVNLGPVVSTWGFDGHPSISADGSTLYFVSNRPDGHGDEDLWQVSITPMPGDFRDDRDSDSAPESVKSNGGKES